MHVSVCQILDHSCNEHDEEITLAIEEERAHEISDSLQDEGLSLGEVDGVDVCKGGRLSQHLDVECTYEMLLDLLWGEIFLGELGLEGSQLSEDYAILLLL